MNWETVSLAFVSGVVTFLEREGVHNGTNDEDGK